MKKIFLTYPALLFSGLLLFVGGTFAATSTSLHNITIIDDTTGESSILSTNATNIDTEEEIILRKSSNKTNINIGETIQYTVSITIQDPLAPPPDPDPLTGTVSGFGDIAYPMIDLVDNFPENFLRLDNIAPSAGMTCQPDATEIRCQIADARVGDTYVLTSEFTALAQGTASNIATVNDRSGTSKTVISNVIILEPGNIFLLDASPDKNVIEVGEEATYTVTLTNRTEAETITDVNLIDDYPEEFLKIISVNTSNNVTCRDDAAEIRCNATALAPGESLTITTVYEGIQEGTANNTIYLTSDQSEEIEFTSSVNIVEAEIQELLLSSDCEGQNIFIGERCAMRVIAVYNFLDERDISGQVDFNGFQNIGTMLENVLTATNIGEANIAATLDGLTSNAILIVVTDGVNIGRDFDGNTISHFPIRTTGGQDIIAAYNDPITIGVVEAGNTAVARNNKITFSDMGVVEILDWFLEDKEFGVIRDANTNAECNELENGLICRGKTAVTFEAGDKEGTALLRVSDDDGNARNFTIHILPPTIEQLSIDTMNGEEIKGAMDFTIQDTVEITASAILIDDTTEEDIQGDLEWEFSHNGGEWTNSSDAGLIARGVFEPMLPGTFGIRAKKIQHLAMPGVNFLTQRDEEILSAEVSVQIGDPVVFVESIRTAGNEDMGKGTSDILFVRIRNINGLDNIQDMELNLLRGSYANPDKILDNTQHFSIDIIKEDIYQEALQNNTVLLQIPFHIPLLDDITSGPHTLSLMINHKNGDLEDTSIGLLPIYIGDPLQGDANLDGSLNLVDAVVAARIIENNTSASGLRIVALDPDQDKNITLRDFLEIFRSLLSTFLK